MEEALGTKSKIVQRIERVKHSRLSEVDFNNLPFGKHISDHMIVAKYNGGSWGLPEIMPFSEMKLSPAMLSLHYGQSVFEGMKAFRMDNGNISIFRPDKHLSRMNRSLARMCMPEIPEEMWISSLQALIETDERWVPYNKEDSLYIRPIVFASEARLGVKISDEYLFIILTSPVGSYQAKPFRLKVETSYVRAAEGGAGYTKCAGNYGAAFYPTQLARAHGYDQILWTDSKEHKYIDEIGMMNVMFILDGKLVTPALSSTILEGVTRDSILVLAREIPTLKIEERRVSVSEIEQGLVRGTLTEAFGTGTAAVVSPIALINFEGKDYHIPQAGPTSFQQQVRKKLYNIRSGQEPDHYGWNYIIHIE